ncbi:MAG: type I secretion C-terminal target domain-containing protein, partial [Dechloromonas sp.]|nr:type I secretion C-terminal target domain-containing protein [Dechloromonas sp.]
TIPQGAAVGDTLTVTAVGNVDKVFTLTAAQIATGFIDTKFNPTSNNTDFKVTAAITDPAGNTAGPVEDSARLQLSAPAEPIVTILEDANNDGWINAAELQGNIDVSVTLPATAVAGNTLISTVNGVTQAPITLTQADIVKGSYALPGIPNPGEGTTLTVTAQIRDAAGNLGNIASDSATIDTRIPNDGVAPIVVITEDADNDGRISAAELNGKVDVRIEFDGTKVDIGDIVRITDGTTSRDISITAADKTANHVLTDFVPPASGQTITVTAHIFDAAGNTTQPGSDSAIIDTDIPNNGLPPEVEITEDANNDGFINRVEASGSADVRVSFNKDKVDVGDTVRISDGTTSKDFVVSATDKANGFVTTDFPLPSNGSTLTVTAHIFDPAGNRSATGTDFAKVDLSTLLDLQLVITEDENNDGFINASELKGSVGVDITLPTDAIAGDLITITATGNPTRTITLIQPQIDAGKLSIEITPPANGTRLEVSAQVTDAAGNKSNIATDAAVINTTPPTLTVQLAPSSDSGTKGDNITNDATPTLIGVTTPGARVTVNIPSTGEQLQTTADSNGNWQITPTHAMPDGTTPVVATATDAIGNTSTTSLPLTIDTTQFTGLTVSIREDENNDGFINLNELKDGDIDVRVTLPDGAAVGDTLTVAASGNIAQVFTLSAAQLATGFIDVKFTPTANNTDFIATASIVDAAGNSAGPVSDQARIQLSPPDAPIVTIIEDANNDGWINAAELQGDIDVRIELPGNVQAGDRLLTTVNGIARAEILITQADIDQGSIALPGIANPGEGSTLTVTAQVRDSAGNFGSIGDSQARIDTTPPALAAWLDPTSDSGIQGDGITNDNTPTLSGTGEPGAAITVTLPGTGEVLKTTVSASGTWTVTPTQPLADGAHLAQVGATDAAGNSSTATVALHIDTHIPNNRLAPTVIITEDANGDGYINRAEAIGNADVRVAFTADLVEVGDVVVVSAGGISREIAISSSDRNNGYVSTDFPMPANGATLTVSAFIVDRAGNTSDTGQASAIVDITDYQGLSIEITEDANNDGFINRSELQDNDIDVRVTLPNGAAIGDTLTITAVGNVDKVFTLTAAQLAAGFIDVKFNPTANNTDFRVTASIVDVAGNAAGPVEDTARIVISPPSEPIVTILEDINNDGWINAAELQGNIDVSVTLPATAVAGDTLLTSINGVAQAGITITHADILKGSIALPGIPNPGDGITLTVEARVKDAAGNIGNPGSDSATIDLAIPNNGEAPAVTILEDINNDGFINRAEASGNADVRIAFNPALVKAGDTVRVTDGTTSRDIVITPADQSKGYVDTDFPLPPDGTTLSVSAYLFDPAGNRSATGTDFAKVDLSALLNLQLVITEDENNDGFINASELKGSVGVDITLPVDAIAGDLITITATGNPTRTITLIQPQIDAGKLSIEITPPANGTRLEVSAQVTDAAGNKSNVATDAAVIAIDPPGAPSVTIVEDANNDGYISAAELSGDIDVRIGLPATAQAGDLLHVSANGTPIAPISLSQDDIDRGNVDIALPNPGDGQQIVVNAWVEDFAGNFGPSGSGSALIDITQFTGLAVTITEDANNDGFINRSELQDDDIDVRVTLPNGAAVGDTLTVTASGNINQVFTLTAAQLAAGFIDVKFNPTANNTDFVATASIADAAGNSAGPVSDQARIQLSAPGLPIVTITEDANNDGWINAAELQGDIDVSVTLPATAVAGAVLVTTVNGVVQPEILISQADINKGSIALPGIANPGEGTTLTVTAQVRDSAGNLGAIGSDSAQIDTRIPNDGHAPVVVIAEDANSDGLISASELQGNVDVRIEFDGIKVDVGDIVRVTDGTTTRNIEINDIDKAKGFVTTDFPPLAAGQTITLRALIEDPAGNRSDEGWQSALFSLVKLDNIQVTVSEEGLAGGIPDPTGNPSDNTDDAFATGNIGVSGSGGVPLEVSVSAPPEAITSGGQALNWSGAGTTASPLIGYAGGSEVIRLSIDSNGNYRVTLAKPIDHANGQDENVATLNFNLSVSDGRTTANAVLTLAIEDDSPKAVPEAEGGAMRHQDTNILLIIDNSGSMAGSRIQILRDSVKQLIESYDMLGDVAVRIVVYNSSASAYTAGWVSASTAIAYVSTLGTGGATNYDAALLTAMQAFQSAGKIPGATNVSYFLSDGDPNARSDWDGSGPIANQVGIQPAEAAIWQAFLESNQINSFAFGMGTEVQQNSMAPVAYNGIDKTPTSAIVVSNERDLAPILRDTVNANFKGNFLDGSLHQGTGAGADGGHLNAFSIDGTSYFIDGSVNGSSAGSFEAATRKWTVFTQAGGKLVIDMDSGDYSYTPPIKDQATTENIAFSIIDNDGDSASSTLALTVQPPPDKIMGGTGSDTLVGTAGDDYIDGGAGNDLIIGGAGADILKGGAGSDTFQWSFGDQGNVGLPAQDRITDFTLGSGGDVLDLRDLLQGENADNLTEYLHFSAVGNNTLLQISSQGQFSGSNHAAMSDQEILLHGVTLNSLAGAGATDAQIISELLKANLKVDL